jgi:hypothetical protein
MNALAGFESRAPTACRRRAHRRPRVDGAPTGRTDASRRHISQYRRCAPDQCETGERMESGSAGAALEPKKSCRRTFAANRHVVGRLGNPGIGLDMGSREFIGKIFPQRGCGAASFSTGTGPPVPPGEMMAGPAAPPTPEVPPVGSGSEGRAGKTLGPHTC